MSARPGQAATTLRVDWILAILSVWLIGGFYVDIWAHAHGQVDDTFFTPWHALLYSGAASFGVATGILAILGKPRSVPIREVLAGPYRQSFIGAVVFAVGGVFDLAWHTAFGFEVEVEALLSPSHLILAAGGLLMLGGPIRSVSERLRAAPAAAGSWQSAGPLVIPLAMASAVLIAFTQYANPIVDAWASADDTSEAEPVAQIHSMAPDGTAQTRITYGQMDARSASLSPDGQWIVYGAEDEESVQIRISRPDGSEDRALTNGGNDFRPAWSPDGTQILFGRVAKGSDDARHDADLYVMNADGSNVRQLTNEPSEDWAGAWSPDGSSIAFNSNRSGTFHVYVMAANGTGQVALTSGPSDDFEPVWSPDGTRLAFTSNRDGGEYGIWLVGAAGGDTTRLATGEGNAYMPAWSPDGSAIAFTSSRTGDFEVFTVASTGGVPVNLTQNPGADDGWLVPTWSPDGASILYPSEGSAPFWKVPYIRQGYGSAGVLVAAAILAGVGVFARRWRLPLGAYTVLVAVPASMATVLSDAYRFIPAALVAGLLADVVAWRWPPGRSRLGDAIVAFAIPAAFFASYFAAMVVTGGIGWTVHLWLGAIITAGVIGLFLDELSRGPRRADA
jgi:Tol biopolymer transport system component